MASKQQDQKKKKEEMEGEAAATRRISKTEFDGLKLGRRDHLQRDEAHTLRCAAQFNKVRTIICVSPSFRACCNAEDSKGQSCASSACISVTISSRHLLESTEHLLFLFFSFCFYSAALCCVSSERFSKYGEGNSGTRRKPPHIPTMEKKKAKQASSGASEMKRKKKRTR